MKLTQFAALLLAVAALPASAATSTTFNFADLTYLNSVHGGFLPTNTPADPWYTCTGGDICSSNLGAKKPVFGGDLTYVDNGIKVVASATYTSTTTTTVNHKSVTSTTTTDATVMQDSDNGYKAGKVGAGLGVYHTVNNSDDNITKGEKLTLTFSQTVKLSDVFLSADGHVPFNQANKLFLLDGQAVTMSSDVKTNLVGKTFTFAFDDASSKAEQFYLGGMTVSAVPEPETYGMLLAGLGLVGFIARRRKQA